MRKIVTAALFTVVALYSVSTWAEDAPVDYRKHHPMTAGGDMNSALGVKPMNLSKEKINQIMEVFTQMGLMYKLIESPKVVPAGDGFIVVFGNKIVKYDKDLNVQKEIIMDVDVASVQKTASKLAVYYSNEIASIINPGTDNAPVGVDGADGADGAGKTADVRKPVEGVKQDVSQGQ